MSENKLIQINNTFNQVPFSHLLGSPLLACIDAQKQAADSSIDYIHSVGFYEGTNEVVNVTFNFYADGRPATLIVPLLTIVPVPFFSVDELDIKFNAMVELNEEEIDEFKGNYSKPVSESNSNYTYDYFSNLNVHMAASKDHVPTGLSTLMGMLDASIRVVETSDTTDVVSSLRLDRKEFDMLVGEEVELIPSSQGDFTWSRSNPDVVEVDQNGKVKALKVGKSRVYVRTENGERIATCLVRVVVKDIIDDRPEPDPDPDPDPDPITPPPPGNTSSQPGPRPAPPIYTSGSGSGSGYLGVGGAPGQTSGLIGFGSDDAQTKDLPPILHGMVGGNILADQSYEDKIGEIKAKVSSIVSEVKEEAKKTIKDTQATVDKIKEEASKVLSSKSTSTKAAATKVKAKASKATVVAAKKTASKKK